MQDFINSKAMATPGIAGGLVMLITNTINYQFDLPYNVQWVVLILSFLVGLVVITDNSVSKPLKLVLYIINSLIIFSMASGTNSIGKKVLENSSSRPESTIKPIVNNSYMSKSVMTFKFTTFQNQDTAKGKSDLRKETLKNSVYTISNAIQSLQTELVNNHKNYENAQQKLNELTGINNNLIQVHTAVSSDYMITHIQNKDFQQQLDKVHNSVKTFQTDLLKGKQLSNKKFFTDW